MHTRRFFLIALLFPLLFTVVALVFAISAASQLYIHLVSSLLIPYALFVLATVIFSRKMHPNGLRRLGCRSPIIFLFFLVGYLLSEFALGLSLATNIIGLSSIIIFLATYVSIFGYLYVLILEQALISFLHQQKLKHKYKFGNLFIDGKLSC